MKLRCVETVGDEEPSVDQELRSCSVSTFERLQEEVIELEARQRRLRRTVDQLRDEERLLVHKLSLSRDRRAQDTGTSAALASLTVVIQFTAEDMTFRKAMRVSNRLIRHRI